MTALVVYIGAAIDQANGSPFEQYDDLKKIVDEALGMGQYVGYSPLHAFFGAEKTRSPYTNKFIARINEEALAMATVAVFVWSDSPSFGVPIEIAHCEKEGIPFVIWDRSTKKTPSVYMQKSVEASDMAFMADSREEVIKQLRNIRNELQGLEPQNGEREKEDVGGEVKT